MSDVNNFEVAQATEEQQRDPSHESHDQPKEEQTANGEFFFRPLGSASSFAPLTARDPGDRTILCNFRRRTLNEMRRWHGC